MLFAPIGSGGTGTMTPQSNHVDFKFYVGRDMRAYDLGRADALVVAAVTQPSGRTNRAQD